MARRSSGRSASDTKRAPRGTRSMRVSRRLSPRLLRIGTQNDVASTSCNRCLRAGALRLVTTHT